jgi:transcriptional regulator with XRE-family HTH domain
MEEAASHRADQALSQYVKGGRTLVDIGTEFVYLRRERGLSQQDLAQRASLPLETVEAIESGKRLPTKQEFALLASGLELTAGRLAETLRPAVRHRGSDIRAVGRLTLGRRRPTGWHHGECWMQRNA